ncbi:DUF3419 family protein [Nisaea sp.]|uniref:DUF3419 family protein n=1 Tax=Nisaea sp. TaxID=2024842 RepID=UPI0032ECA405
MDRSGGMRAEPRHPGEFTPMTANSLLTDAVIKNRQLSKRGILERMFTMAFKGFVYPQIWEDPEVDLEALQLDGNSRIFTIASGGCNILNYLTEQPAHIQAVDLNPAHVALTRLKLTALEQLPDHETFFRFFGHADERENKRVYFRDLAPHLDPETRAYWSKRGLRGRRIDMFTRNVYEFGLLGRFIGLLHFVARLHGKNPRHILRAETMEEQRTLFEDVIGPVFDSRIVKALCRMPVSFYGLGIPPAQFEALSASAGGDMAGLMRSRLERLACDFSIDDNYFAWQAFGRGYDRQHRQAIPRYLRDSNHQTLRDNASKVDVVHASMTDFLAGCDAESRDRYILLDAQDWMNAEQMTALWTEILRTSAPGARVIFRTAGEESPLPGRVPAEILDRWDYRAEQSLDLARRDRSSIYGGFHLYIRRD